MRVNLKRINSNYNFVAVNSNNNSIHIDASKDIGGNENGFRPMELLLASLGGCSSIDVILILKKQKIILDSIEVEVNGDRENVGNNSYSLFKNIEVHFIIKGIVEFDKVERAVSLSIEKYCSVAKILEPTTKISHKITLN
jgi:putative redox protein